MPRPDGQVFELFGKPYRWDEALRLHRVSDDEARCAQILERGEWTMRCRKLAGHDGNHAASAPS